MVKLGEKWATSFVFFLIINMIWCGMGVTGHRNGAPIHSCNTLIPNPSEIGGHGAFPNRTVDSPYRIRVTDLTSGRPVYEYKPGSMQSLKVETKRCGKGFGCFRHGHPGCIQDDSCNYTVMWHCLNNKVLFEVMGTTPRPIIRSSYVALAFSLDASLSGDEVISCHRKSRREAQVISYVGLGRNLYPSKPAAATKTLKTAANDHKFLCRFIREHSPRRYTIKDFQYLLFGNVYTDGTLDGRRKVKIKVDENGSQLAPEKVGNRRQRQQSNQQQSLNTMINICKHSNIFIPMTPAASSSVSALFFAKSVQHFQPFLLLSTILAYFHNYP